MANYYYNNVLLSEIPSSIVSEYPYHWIRNNSGTYQLICAKESWYFNINTNNYSHNDTTTQYGVMYTYSNGIWGNPQELPIPFSERVFIWCNHDIYKSNGDLYKKYYIPVPENISYESTGNKYLYNGIRLPEIPQEVLDYYPYAIIRFDTIDNCYDVIYAQSEFTYNVSSKGVFSTTTQGNGYIRCTIPIDWQSANETWVFVEKSFISTGWGHNTEKIIMWCNLTIESVLNESIPISEDLIEHTYKIERITIERLATQLRRIKKQVNSLTIEDMIELLKSI